MKIVKPQPLGVLVRPFEHEGKARLVVTLLACSPLANASSLLHESKLWKAATDALGPEGALDLGMAKPRGEVLVIGHAHAKDGAPTTATSVRLEARLGGRELEKELYVIGDRRWGAAGPTEPEPFTRMHVSFSRAFGGEGHEQNPAGRGHKPVEVDGEKVHLLPNVEDPRALLKSKGDTPRPVGFGPLDVMSLERRRHMGTYDKRWLDTRFPGYAEDFHWEFWNVAPVDQRLDGFFTGAETFAVHGMHPSERVVQGGLTRGAPRAFVLQKQADGSERFREVTGFKIDTVALVPHVSAVITLFRAVIDVRDDEAHDVTCLLAALEDPDAPKTVEHYRAVLDKRLDKKNGALAMLKDGDLLPPFVQTSPDTAAFDEIERALRSDDLLRVRLERHATKQLEVAKEEAIRGGLPREKADELFQRPTPAEPAPTDPDAVAAWVETQLTEAKSFELRAEELRQKAEAEARAALEAQGLDFDEVVEKQRGGGPPKLGLDKNLEVLRALAEGQRPDPELIAKLEEVEAKMMEAYRRYTHFFPHARRLSNEESAALRSEIERARASGDSLSYIDLTGADLRGADLSGLDLEGALMEMVDLEGANLEGANLEGATLARGRLVRARLAGARVVGVNFGEADLLDADFGTNADLTGATFYRAMLAGTKLVGAKLDGAQLLETKGDGVDLSGASLTKAVVVDSSFAGARFVGAQLGELIGVDVSFEGADLTRASLRKITLVRLRGEGAKLVSADLRGARVVLESTLARCDLRGARLGHACLRTTSLAGADLSGAAGPGADFSECDLTEARLRHADWDGANFTRATLLRADLGRASFINAILAKADVRGADFREAVLFRADLAKVEGDKNTRFGGADLRQIRVVAQQAKPEASP